MSSPLIRAAVIAAAAVVVPATHADDIVDTAVAAGSFGTLAAALEAADLVDALKGEGPFTVFAPTDAAFERLPDGTVEALLEKNARELLTSILTFHVVPGRLSADDLLRTGRAVTLNGQRVDVATDGRRVTVDGATVRRANIECSNGIIHVIDAVIMPTTDDIVDVATSAGQFGTLLEAAKAAGLAGVLRSDGPFTLLAPTDEAFAALPSGTVASLLKRENRDQLAAILKYHVISGRVFADKAIEAGTAKTLQGKLVRFTLADGRLKVNGSNVIANDIDASNGVIHAIDRVLMPPVERETPDGRLVIGVYTESVGAALAAQLGIDPDTAMLVTGLVDGGNAERAGLKRFDVITAIDGKPATSGSLRAAKERRGFGGRLELSIIRAGKPRTIEVEVGVERH